MPFCWMKFCSGCFRQVFFIWGMGGGGGHRSGCWLHETGGCLMP